MPASARNSVFISYSHADEKWRKLVEKHLIPLKRDHKLRIWSDQSLQPGEPWLTRIRQELATARVGILLVSVNFLASDFIHSDELPPLLAAARQEGVTLLTIWVGHCHYAASPLSRLQSFNKPEKPLADLTPTQRDKEITRLCALLLKIFGPQQPTPKPAIAKKTALLPKGPRRVAAIPALPAAAPAAATGAKAKAIAKGKAIAKNKAGTPPESPAAAAKKTPTPG